VNYLSCVFICCFLQSVCGPARVRNPNQNQLWDCWGLEPQNLAR